MKEFERGRNLFGGGKEGQSREGNLNRQKFSLLSEASFNIYFSCAEDYGLKSINYIQII